MTNVAVVWTEWGVWCRRVWSLSWLMSDLVPIAVSSSSGVTGSAASYGVSGGNIDSAVV